ncbi:hypothetical protein BH23ACT9_BH23ACT9_21170 [soil metagenome]
MRAVADVTASDTTADAGEATGNADAPAIELTRAQRALRDHLTAAFPGLTATAYRGELTLTAPADQLVALLGFCKSDPAVSCELLSDVSAVHWPAGAARANDQETTGWPTYTSVNEDGRIEVSYIVRSVTLNHWFRIRVAVPDTGPEVPSATAHYASANFLEREVFDLMGVVFTGHPNLSRIMMPDDWDGHPLRKDYPLGGVEVMYHGQTIPPPDEREY